MENNNTEIRIYEKKSQIKKFLLKKWLELATIAIEDHGIFVVAISGGKTPLEFYQELANYKEFTDWDKVYFFIVDERFVKPGHKDHNFTNIEKELFQKISKFNPVIHSIDTSFENVEHAASSYNSDLSEFFKQHNNLNYFDLVLLGIGEDGHIASLFPDTPALEEDKKLVTFSKPKTAKYDRITLTYPIINNSQNVIFVAIGEKKAVVIKDLIENAESNLPASKIEPLNGTLYFVIDSLAASKIFY
jgi:6-phosphogluconolactonase